MAITSIDSHIKLPVLKQNMARLKRYELKPFMAAVGAGVRMVMLGHLAVPAIDPSGVPVSFSENAVQFIRRGMGYDGILITDALNMGGIGHFSEQERLAVRLRPAWIFSCIPQTLTCYPCICRKRVFPASPDRLLGFRKRLKPRKEGAAPLFDLHQALSRRLTEDAISVTGKCRIRGVR